jgi:spore maturation protein CgeB
MGLMPSGTHKILLYGETSRAGSGAWCYAETLRDMGHNVHAFSDRHDLGEFRNTLPAKVARKLLTVSWEPRRKRHVRSLVAVAEKARPEVVIVLKGLQVDHSTVLALRDLGAWVANINHDDFFSHNRNNRSSIQRRAIKAYNHIFATREVNVAEVAALNRNVEFFPFAYYPRIHRPAPLSVADAQQWESDVVFVGTWEKSRASMIDNLICNVPGRYAIYGSQWEKLSRRSPTRSALRGGEVALDEMAKALGGAKIALGFLRKENRDDYTQRTFEIPACGGVLLGERTHRQQGWFREGIEAEYFDAQSPAELCEKVRSLLADPARRESIREAGMQALRIQHHTYEDRLARLMEVYASRSR